LGDWGLGLGDWPQPPIPNPPIPNPQSPIPNFGKIKKIINKYNKGNILNIFIIFI